MIMQLQEFVTESLVQIVTGVKEASTRLAMAKSDVLINPQPVTSGEHCRLPSVKDKPVYTTELDPKRIPRPVETIEFDVAVTAEASSGTKGGIGVVAGVFALGSQGKSDTSHTTISRPRFAVPVVLPCTIRNPEPCG
jgi:hypothetical protein